MLQPNSPAKRERDIKSKQIIKLFILATLAIVLVVGGAYFAIFEYGRVVSRGELRELQITTDSQHPKLVNIDGRLLSAALVVGSVKQYVKGRCIVVVVRKVFVHGQQRSASFHIKVPVSDNIDEIAFGTSRDVIWHR